MRHRHLGQVVVAIILVVSLAATAAVAAAAPKRRFVIATAGTAGALYPMGVAMAETINRHSDRFMASAESSAASVANLRNLHEGNVEWGIAQSEIATFAYNGQEIFKGREMKELRALFATVGSYFQVFVPASSPVRSIQDLKGKRVGVGQPGSGGEIDARMVLAHCGLDYKSVTPAFLTDAEMVDALRDGDLDAIMVTHPLRSAALIDLTTSFKVRMLSVDDPAFYASHPFFLQATVPAGTYDSVDVDVRTPFSRVIMFTTTGADFSDDDIYHLLDTIFSNREEWRTSHASVDRTVTLEAALDGIAVPLHPGAVKYFQDHGLTVPAELLPAR
ncbi:TAXI family TRAP transporter solute-binding subunit [Limnochorda pilosa]|uniref:C4-dicarboxylate ABC transporter substrate-binding protein n=1 Tax=Limnochorda pilosa TaxID=1555112 RepID=A0A0K2SN18_LIMPI|nr:TAXI family TRAP transporter solute-binding subunit [Limnochorda pilosa]BAS28204.1 C4-dicarboxylate ABC transporter substrate-binding protein [Limnochorda pilosa]